MLHKIDSKTAVFEKGKAFLFLAFLGMAICLIAFTPGSVQAGADDLIAVAIVYDSSGSMKDSVQNDAGKPEPKYLIANRALLAVVNRFQQFAETSKNQKLEACLVTFNNGSVGIPIPFGEFKPNAFRQWVQSAPQPDGGTPLGDAIRKAALLLMDSKAKHQHILVVTDGMNTMGTEPAAVIPSIRKQAAAKETSMGIHFVGFDIASKIFDPLKKLDVTVVSAANEKQLNTQLGYIVEQKILLEDEEPPAKKP